MKSLARIPIERLWYFIVAGDDDSVFGWEAPEFEKHLHTPVGEWEGDEDDAKHIPDAEEMADRIEGVLNQTQAVLVAHEGLSVEEALTAVATKIE